MLTGHFSGLSAQLKSLLANSAMRFRVNMSFDDLNRGHRLNCSLGSRGLLNPTNPINLNLSKLIQQPIKPRPQQKLRHAGRQGPQPRTTTVIIIEIVPSSLTALTFGWGPQHNDRVERRPVASVPASTADPWAGRNLIGIRISGHIRRDTMLARIRNRGRLRERRVDFFNKAALTVGTNNGRIPGGTPNPNESIASVTPVRRRGRCRRRHLRQFASGSPQRLESNRIESKTLKTEDE